MDGLLWVAGMIITSDDGSFPHSLLSTSKTVPQVSATPGCVETTVGKCHGAQKKTATWVVKIVSSPTFLRLAIMVAFLAWAADVHSLEGYMLLVGKTVTYPLVN